MPRYFFHLCEGGETTKDISGTLLPHIEGAIDQAKTLANELVAEAAMSGRSISWGAEYEVEDENGHLAIVLPLTFFVEAASHPVPR